MRGDDDGAVPPASARLEAGGWAGLDMAGWVSTLAIAVDMALRGYLLDCAFAWLPRIGFEYFTVVPMRDVGLVQGLWAAPPPNNRTMAAFSVRRPAVLD